ncbi:hypothetical protein MRX96_003958 [Rhipicephalus microplus]
MSATKGQLAVIANTAATTNGKRKKVSARDSRDQQDDAGARVIVREDARDSILSPRLTTLLCVSPVMGEDDGSPQDPKGVSSSGPQ